MIGGQQEVQFDKDLYHFVSMAFEIWPTLKSAVRHLQQINEQSSNSFLPRRNYSQMSEQTFFKTITDDFFEFIMTHDVKSDDIEDYMNDILDLLMIEEQLIGGNKNPASVSYMSKHLMRVIQELQNGKKTLINDFEVNVYNNVKMFKGQIIEDKNNSEDSQEDNDSQEEENSEQEQQRQNYKEKPKKTQQQLKRQEELEQDGWVIVRKK